MRSVLYCSDMPEMSEPRARVSRISIWIANWPLRRRTRRNHPFPARDLGLQEAISQCCDNRDGIKHEDQQDHRVDEIDVQPIIGDGDHQLEADPVEQRQDKIEFGIPRAPEPVGCTRRRRGRLFCRFDVINILHVQSLSEAEDNTTTLGVETGQDSLRYGNADTNFPKRELQPFLPPPFPTRSPSAIQHYLRIDRARARP